MRNRIKMFYVVLFVGVFLCATMFGGLAFAQEKFPTKPISIIVPYAAGGGHDLVTRIVQTPLEKSLGQPIVVINKTGGGSTIALSAVRESAPDGYTIGITLEALLAVQYTIPQAGIKYTDFEPIVYFGNTPNILAVRKEAPWNTLKEFIDYAKANPGKVSVGNSSQGGNNHLEAIAIERAAGVKFIHTPYKGTAASIPDLLGGHVHAIAAGLADTISLVKGGKVRLLGITPQRSKAVPEVPTFKEQGLDVDFGQSYIFVGPKGIPAEKVKVLYNAFKAAAESKEVKDFFDRSGSTIALQGPEGLGKWLQAQDKICKELVAVSGIQP